jgi:hypothetical protein
VVTSMQYTSTCLELVLAVHVLIIWLQEKWG